LPFTFTINQLLNDLIKELNSCRSSFHADFFRKAYGQGFKTRAGGGQNTLQNCSHSLKLHICNYYEKRLGLITSQSANGRYHMHGLCSNRQDCRRMGEVVWPNHHITFIAAEKTYFTVSLVLFKVYVEGGG